MQNPYQTLGVDRNATADEIKRAYRKLASQHHPDKGGDKAKFQDIQVAYDILTNPQRRAAHDNPSPFGPSGFSFRPGDGGFDFDSIFNAFGARFQHPQQRMQQQARMTLWVTLQDVAQATKRTVSVGIHQGTQVIEIEIPAGINDGDTVQYSGILSGMDLLITFRIHPNPKWSRQGPHLTTEHEISIWDLILGSDIQVKDVLGNTLSLNIPAKTQPGTIFRLKERGLKQRSGPTGDLLVRIQATIPNNIPESIITAIVQNRNQ
jgi:DnaJ-class molecular chaperone